MIFLCLIEFSVDGTDGLGPDWYGLEAEWYLRGHIAIK